MKGEVPGAATPRPEAGQGTRPPGQGPILLLGRLALQNLGRRPTRTALLVLAVAIGSGAVFATATLMRGLETSVGVGFSRLGADLLVVPKGTLVNIKAALLTVEPSELTMDADVAAAVAGISGVRRVSPQRFFRSADSYCCIIGQADLIAFDPLRDFTVLPWVREKLDRGLRKGDVIVGGLRGYRLGEQVYFYGQPLTVYGRLGRTGVGTYDNAFFMTFETADALARGSQSRPGVASLRLEPRRFSALLLQLELDATPEAVRFAIARNPEVKVVAGGSLVTSVRQGLTALFGGTMALAVLMLLSTGLVVGVVFSAIVAERRRELGLLRVIGAKRGQIARLLLVESMVATGLGGLAGVVLGVALLRLYRRSLVFYFDMLNVPFVWPTLGSTTLVAIACLLAAVLVGGLGALYPAWRASRQEPYELIRVDG